MEAGDRGPGRLPAPGVLVARALTGARIALSVVGAAGLVAALLLMTVDVAGREIIDSPVYGAYEIVELMMTVIVFAGLPLVTGARGHVTVGLFRFHRRRGFRSWMPRVIHLFCAVVLAGVAYRLWEVGGNFIRYHEVTMGLRIPLGPVAYLASVLTGVAALAALGMAVLNTPPEQADSGV